MIKRFLGTALVGTAVCAGVAVGASSEASAAQVERSVTLAASVIHIQPSYCVFGKNPDGTCRLHRQGHAISKGVERCQHYGAAASHSKDNEKIGRMVWSKAGEKMGEETGKFYGSKVGGTVAEGAAGELGGHIGKAGGNAAGKYIGKGLGAASACVIYAGGDN